MILSRTYTEVHTAYRVTASSSELLPFDVRVLIAVAEAGGSIVSDTLEGVLQSEGSAVRRTLSKMYRRGLLAGEAHVGGRRKRGVRTRAMLTDDGRRVVDLFYSHLEALRSTAVAA